MVDEPSAHGLDATTFTLLKASLERSAPFEPFSSTFGRSSATVVTLS